jgi:pyruvate ferredoxin oxidoreductase gamma subunit
MYEIRLESIGGLGANLAGKLLGEAGAYYMGKNAQFFASYGSEKRGSPVKAYVRYAPIEENILISSPVREPDLLCLFTIAVAGKENVTAGVKENTAVVVNTHLPSETVRDRLRLAYGRIFTVDALKAGARVNMVMLGAMACASDVIDINAVKAAVSDELGKKYPDMLADNLRGIDYGYKNAVEYVIPKDNKFEPVIYEETHSNYGCDNAPIGGINPLCGNIITNRTDSSREGYVPIFHKDKCINCGLCDTTCPDMVFQFALNDGGVENLGLDYYHCKGCLRCVEVCPTKALTVGNERETDVWGQNIGYIPLLNKDFRFDATSANGYVTSESEDNTEVSI